MNKVMDNFGVFDYSETAEGTYEYTAAEMRSYFAAIVGNGVLKGVAGQFAATAAGLTVSLSTGEGWLLGVHGEIVDDIDFVLDPVVSGMSRICSIVMDVDTIAQQMGISVLVGTQATSPSDPVLTETATRYQQLLHKAQIHDNGTITLTDGRSFVTRPGDGVDLASIGAAAKSAIATFVLNKNNWSAGNYTITAANVPVLAAVTTETMVEILPGLTITDAELEALQGANIQDAGQSAGSITIKARAGAPTIDIPIRIVIRGDLY